LNTIHVTTTNTVGIQAKPSQAKPSQAKPSAATTGITKVFCTEETHWGYIIWSTSDTSDGLTLTKSLSLLAGAALFAAAIFLTLTLTLTLTKRQAAPVPILHRYVSASAAM
jgi:hypothetical protein